MARPLKTGLDYYPKDVDMWDDFKIMDLMEHFGTAGYVVYDVTISMVYKNGYYLKAPLAQLCALILRKVGNRWIENKSEIERILLYCGEIGLFDKELLSHEVITSVGIQRRYAVVTARNKVDRSNYWLLPQETSPAAAAPSPASETPSSESPLPEDTLTHGTVPEAAPGSAAVPSDTLPDTPQSRSAAETRVIVTETPHSASDIPQKKRKEKKRKCKVKESVWGLKLPCKDGELIITDRLLDRYTHTYPRMKVEESLHKLESYLRANPIKRLSVDSTMGYIDLWLGEDDHCGKYRKGSSQPAYDFCDYENWNVADSFLEENEFSAGAT